MIYVTGDTHAGWIHRLNTEYFPEQKEMTRQDYVIVLGDFGIWDHSKEQKHDLDWLNAKPFTTLFLDGNHENFDILDALPVTEFAGGKVHAVRPYVLHLMRGQIFTLEGRTFFTFGGGQSHDIRDGILEPDEPNFKQKKRALDKRLPTALYRINHQTWWARELPSDDETEEGWHNLESRNFSVDYILTHAPYSALLAKMDCGAGRYHPDRLTDYLQKVKQNTEYRQWLFGHMHVNQMFPWERAACLYEQISRLL